MYARGESVEAGYCIPSIARNASLTDDFTVMMRQVVQNRILSWAENVTDVGSMPRLSRFFAADAALLPGRLIASRRLYPLVLLRVARVQAPACRPNFRQPLRLIQV
jgi:hypothetical protein